jgi:hypothetical protein
LRAGSPSTSMLQAPQQQWALRVMVQLPETRPDRRLRS